MVSYYDGTFLNGCAEAYVTRADELFDFTGLCDGEWCCLHFIGALGGAVILGEPVGTYGCLPVKYGFTADCADYIEVFDGVEYVAETEGEIKGVVNDVEEFLPAAMADGEVGGFLDGGVVTGRGGRGESDDVTDGE